MNNLSLLISSCDKFSDLWQWHIKLLNQNWQGEKIKTYLVTDKPTEAKFEGVEIIVAPSEYDFPKRIKFALDYINTDYVLLTLDDYFNIFPINADSISFLLDIAEQEKIDYLKLYDRKKDKPKKFTSIDAIDNIDLSNKYAVTLYPAIWSKSFLSATAREDLSPWLYEVSLTKTANEQKANCKFSGAGAFRILDVVRKGKVLRKANKYFKKNGIDIGDRPLISRWQEFKLKVMDYVDWHFPKWLKRFFKKIAKLFGKKFYSED